ncbi:hypothetical protein PIB30_054069 [Stylosanthes scabra]|uniref:Replication factor A C-terminal domain-containing protein n=1 Tax=Stylosanthes scabra TaxID=79078 RepID=A0ABU6WKB5_9FABA|nr:hypothetical protein [Stylosanthes scabra]
MPHKNLKNPVILVGKVASVLAGVNWWYSIYPCGKKIEPNQNDGFCPFCFTNCSDGLPRYHVKLFVAHSGGCNLFVFHDETLKYLLGKSCRSLLNGNQSFILSEILEVDPNLYLSELIGRKLVLMVDPDITDDFITHVGYHVFKSSNDPSLIKLFELAEKGAIMKKEHRCRSTNQLLSSNS